MLIMFGPVLMLALFSFNDSSIISLPWEGFTTRWYEEAWATTEAREAIINSLMVAAVVTAASLVLGTLAAWGLTRLRFAGRGALAGLHGSVLVVPWLIIGVAGLIFFSESGDLALADHGRPDAARGHLPARGRDHLGRPGPLLALDRGGGDRPRRLAGADDPLRRPARRSHPSLAAASIFAFAWSFNNFEVSFFTGGFEQTFPVWVFSILRQSENLPMVNAVSTVIALAQVIVVFAGWRLMKRLTRDRGGDSALTDLLTGGAR